MSDLMGGGSVSRTNQTGGRTPAGHGLPMLFDLFGRSLIGNVMSPQATPIPVPLQQAISGVQDIAPSLFNQAFGPTRGLASSLGPPPGAVTHTGESPAGGFNVAGLQSLMSQLGMGGGAAGGGAGAGPSIGAPAFGRTQTRTELGLPEQPAIVAPGYLPPEEEVQANLPTVRIPTERRRERRLENRLERLALRQEQRIEAGKTGERVGRRIARTEQRLERLRNRPGRIGQ